MYPAGPSSVQGGLLGGGPAAVQGSNLDPAVGGWIAQTTASTEWYQFVLGPRTAIAGVRLMGRPGSSDHITELTVYVDRRPIKRFTGLTGELRDLLFPSVVHGRRLRLTTFASVGSISLRADVILPWSTGSVEAPKPVGAGDGFKALVYKQGVEMAPVRTRTGDAYYLKSRSSGTKCQAWVQPGTPLLGVPDKARRGRLVFYLHDARLKLITNTLDAPAVQPPETEGIPSRGLCPSVAKTFVNAASCVRHEEGTCRPLEYQAGTTITLDAATLRRWYEVGHSYVYSVHGLRMDTQKTSSRSRVYPPCSDERSRWERADGPCSSVTSRRLLGTVAPTPGTAATVVAALLQAKEAGADVVRDIRVKADVSSGVECWDSAQSIGTSVDIDGSCWTQVHPNEFGVFDFSVWAAETGHPGNTGASRGGRRNPITQPAESGSTTITFPAWHPMQNWDLNFYFHTTQSVNPGSAATDHPYELGRLGDTIDFTALKAELQTPKMAQAFGVKSSASDASFEACGSRGEVANTPELGNHYRVWDFTYQNQGYDLSFYYWDASEENMWYNTVLAAPDQLRCRVAWALSQIFVASEVNFYGGHESWASFYDIFVANAFGSYRTIVREVAASPIMAGYLSMEGNKKFKDGVFPDENFARELMQLFTLGFFQLNEDGSTKKDASTGLPLPVYSNDNIEDFARIWTGYRKRRVRGNILKGGVGYKGGVDPLELFGNDRDRLPKNALGPGYIGDAFPLCDELPERNFLVNGARYHLTGEHSAYGLGNGLVYDDDELATAGKIRKHFAPDAAKSQLYAALCKRAGKTGRCTFPDDVVLDKTLACHGKVECNADTIRTVKLVDTAGGKAVTKFYMYVAPECVRLTLYDDGRQTGQSWTTQCTDPRHALTAGTTCCAMKEGYGREQVVSSASGDECLYIAEPMRWATAKKRCAELYQGGFPCKTYDVATDWQPGNPPSRDWGESCAGSQYDWQGQPCALWIQVHPTGRIGIIDTRIADGRMSRSVKHSEVQFRVQWDELGKAPSSSAKQVRRFPTVGEQGCGPCDVVPELGGSCICKISVEERAVFTNASATPPTVAQLRGRLAIASRDPGDFPVGAYTVCTTKECRSQPGVKVYTKGNVTAPKAFDKHTVFEIVSAPPGRYGVKRAKYLLNRASSVHVGEQEAGGAAINWNTTTGVVDEYVAWWPVQPEDKGGLLRFRLPVCSTYVPCGARPHGADETTNNRSPETRPPFFQPQV